MEKHNIYDLSMAELNEWAASRDLKPYSAEQLVQWLYEKRVGSFDDMTNLSKVARARLMEEFVMTTPQILSRHPSVDGAIKMTFKLHDGAIIESVLMPQQGRITLCVSSQVGCAMGCGFCKTAEMKLARNLRQGEILGQVLEAMRFCESESSELERMTEVSARSRITNIVFMGMGEPLHNFKPVVESVRILLVKQGFDFSKWKVTVSTAGLCPEIVKFGQEVPARLAVSLNAPNDKLRTALMPINERYDLQSLMLACREYTLVSSAKVTFEYVLINDINDSVKHAAEFVRLVAHIPCKINLIPFNEYPGSPYRRPEKERVLDFYRYLADRKFQVNIRYSKGFDVMAACGQLATITEKRVA